ncbi:MAG: formylglycine-generating enzyme family protein [Planctomycetaceae bacterium]|jgi:formylglycine-generating enzyme required for sulfatase activity|nr:formylglycine-generating enzyme family protein [Planctomycetaceae bacterium]
MKKISTVILFAVLILVASGSRCRESSKPLPPPLPSSPVSPGTTSPTTPETPSTTPETSPTTPTETSVVPDPAPVAATAEPKTAQEISARKRENLKNPFFKSSLEFLKDPVPVDNADAKTESEMKLYVEKIAGSDQTFKMIPLKGGKFLMGSPENEKGRRNDESPQHEVELKPFWIAEHETTWKEFEQFALKILRDSRKEKSQLTEREKLADALASPTPPYDISSISHDNAGKIGYPASGMTAYAAQLYCRWLMMITGRYYRLPTEAEWEYACRAGSTTAYSFGDDENKLGDYAWFFDNSDGSSKKIMTKKPNAWGLYDMHGNLSEWVLEQYDVKTYANRKPNSFGVPVKPPKGDGFGQVARGGNCEDDEAINLRSARRLYSETTWKQQDPQFPQSIWWVTDAAYVGFRVVRPLEPPKTEEEAKLYEPLPSIWIDYAELNQRD